MTKRLMSTMIIVSLGALSGCDNSAIPVDDQVIATPSEQAVSASDDTASGTIDWSRLATGVLAIDRADFDYPFDIDGQNVKDYADYFDVDTATAQHNLTVGMASNEALSKALDQLSNSYTSHELTDGDNVELIIHTTPEIEASRFDYVFESDYAKGLVLPIVIVPDGKKSEGDVHSEMVE